MSSVLEYYQERADQLNLCAFPRFPQILNGEPVELMGGDTSLAIHKPDAEIINDTTARYAQVLKSAVSFAMEAAIRQFPTAQANQYDGNVVGANTRHMNNWIRSKLLPQKVSVGHVEDIQIAAIARHMINERLFRAATPQVPDAHRAGLEDRSIYFMSSGTLRIGARDVGPVACLTVLYIGNNSDNLLAARYLAAPHHHADGMERRRSQAISARLSEASLRNPLINSVGSSHTGQSRRNRRNY